MQAIFFDIDDTLIRKSDSLIPESTISALTTLHQKGILTGIITGRSPSILPQAIRKLMAKCHIELLSTTNGQYSEYRGKPIHQHPLPYQDLEKFVILAQQKNWAYLLHSNTELTVSRLDRLVMPTMYGVSPWFVNPHRWQETEIYQLAYFIEDKVALVEALAPLNLSELYQVAQWHPTGIDVIPQSGSKARAIREICRALNIDLAKTMAFGDGDNDIEMLQTVGIGIAMGNACPALKSVADYITTNIEDNGIANALKHFQLI